MGNFELDPSYKDVPTRIADFKALHPDGCLRPVNPDELYRIEVIKDQYFIVYAAAAYRTPDDKLPGIGVAWEPFPGKTPYTANSELQNAETSAWGRAIVAALRSESKAVASAEDVRNRQADAAAPTDPTTVRACPDTLAAFHQAKDALSDTQRRALKAWFETNDVPAVDKASEANVQAATDAALAMATQEGASSDATVSELRPPAQGEGVESSPNGTAPTPATGKAVGKVEVAALADVVFLGDAAKAKPGKKTAAKKALRYALTYALTEGKAQSLDDLDPDGLHQLHNALLAIQAGIYTVGVDYDPGAGVKFGMPGGTVTVLWSELSCGAPS